MRITQLIVACAVATLVTAMPALAKHAESQKSEDKTSSSCHAYQQAADGSWTALPCQEAGGAHTEHKPPAKGGEDEQR